MKRRGKNVRKTQTEFEIDGGIGSRENGDRNITKIDQSRRDWNTNRNDMINVLHVKEVEKHLTILLRSFHRHDENTPWEQVFKDAVAWGDELNRRKQNQRQSNTATENSFLVRYRRPQC